MKKIYGFSLLALLAIPLLIQINVLEVVKLKAFDSFVKEYEPTGNVVVLDITEEDVSRLGGWPFPRETLAQIHVELLNEGAIAVAWVAAFSEPDRFDGDPVFAEALSYAPSVLAMFETDTWKEEYKTEGTVILGDNIGGVEASGLTQNIPILRDVSLQGIVSAPVEVDNLLRQMPLLMRTPTDGWVASLGTQLLKIASGTETYVIKTNDLGIEEVRVRSLDPIPTDKDGRLWVNWVVPRGTSLADMDVANKIVIVGVTAKGVLPQVATPNGLQYPHHIQASFLETMIHATTNPMPHIPDTAPLYELLIYVLGVLLVWLILNTLGVTAGVLTATGVMLSTGYTGYVLIHSYGLLIDVTWTLMAEFITGAVAFYLNFREQYKLRQQIKEQFGTYISPEYVDIIVKNPDLMVLGGQKKEMTYLFCDIVGFTPISESYMKRDDPEGLVDLINKFLDQMTKLIINNGGTLDKYMGDCIMCWWGAPIPREDHAKIAVQTAIELELLCQQINKDLKEQGLDLPPVMFGTGLSTGNSIVGNTGSTIRMNYSVIGDAVNLGARLEGETRKQDTPILLPQSTYDQIQNDIACTMIDKIKVKGKEEEITIYAPLIEGKVRKLKK